MTEDGFDPNLDPTTDDACDGVDANAGDADPPPDEATPEEDATTSPADDSTKLSLQRIAESERAVQMAALEHEAAKERAKTAKTKWEAACSRLCEVIREEVAPKQPDLFSSPPPAEPPTDDGQAEDDAWRSVPVASLGLPAGIVEKLGAAGLTTMGDLSDYREPNANGFCRAFTDVDGIGQKKAEQIDAAMVQFWEEQQRPATVPFNADTEEGE